MLQESLVSMLYNKHVAVLGLTKTSKGIIQHLLSHNLMVCESCSKIVKQMPSIGCNPNINPVLSESGGLGSSKSEQTWSTPSHRAN